MRCRRAQCPSIATEHAMVVRAVPSSEEEEVSEAQCNAGYQVQNASFQDAYGVACRDTFLVRCLNGSLSYSSEGVVWTSQAPVCERHCGDVGDVCGSASCGTDALYNVVENGSSVESGYVGHGLYQTVACDMGFREGGAESSFSTCASNRSFVRECGNCHFKASKGCRRIRCEWRSEMDPEGVVEGSETPMYGETTTVVCNS
eukprot:2761768-Rhodomonas_salina.1